MTITAQGTEQSREGKSEKSKFQ